MKDSEDIATVAVSDASSIRDIVLLLNDMYGKDTWSYYLEI